MARNRDAEKRVFAKTTTKIPHTQLSSWQHKPTTIQNKSTAKLCSFSPMPQNHFAEEAKVNVPDALDNVSREFSLSVTYRNAHGSSTPSILEGPFGEGEACQKIVEVQRERSWEFPGSCRWLLL